MSKRDTYGVSLAETAARSINEAVDAGENISVIHAAAREFTDTIHREACRNPSAKVITLARELCRAEGNNPNDLVTHFVLPTMRNSVGHAGSAIVRPSDLIPAWCLYLNMANAAITALDKAREEEMRGGPDTERDIDAMMYTLASMFRFRDPSSVFGLHTLAEHSVLNGSPLGANARRGMIGRLFSNILKQAEGDSTICWHERPTLVIDGDTARLSCRLDFAP